VIAIRAIPPKDGDEITQTLVLGFKLAKLAL